MIDTGELKEPKQQEVLGCLIYRFFFILLRHEFEVCFVFVVDDEDTGVFFPESAQLRFESLGIGFKVL